MSHCVRFKASIPLVHVEGAEWMQNASNGKQRAFAGMGQGAGDDDDDGHAAGTNFVTHDQAQEISELVDACRGIDGFNERAFWQWVAATCPQEVPAARYGDEEAALRCYERAEMVTDMIRQLQEVWEMANSSDEPRARKDGA